MKRRQVTEQAVLLETDPAAWEPPDPELEALAVEIDEVMYGRRREMPGAGGADRCGVGGRLGAVIHNYA